jgi:long-chain acyl-CoA synthetase
VVNSKSIYQERPWLKSYPAEVSSDVEVPVKSVAQAFDEATDKWGEKTALIFYGKKISYRELRDKVDRLAMALYRLGIKKGDRVALLLLNSPEHVMAFYAVLKIGATVVPVSPVYVSTEIRHQLQDSGVKSIICQDMLYDEVVEADIELENVILTNISESLPGAMRLLGKSVLREVYQKMEAPSPKMLKQKGMYQLQELIKQNPPAPPSTIINPKEDIMSISYTGGTTALPKGAMLTHYSIIAAEQGYHAFYPFFEEGKETMVAYMPFHHIAGQAMALLGGIIRGATLVLITTPDVDDILNSTIRYRATHFFGAPTIYEMLKDYEKTTRVNWKGLKIIFSGADVLYEATASGWQARTGTTIHDLYGMTECPGVIASPRGGAKKGSIGIPLPNVIAAIVDPDKDEFLPVGELGELAVSGPQVTIGYWDNPKATKECEAVIDGRKWFRTGDLARMEEDGYFYIYDRKRDLIKYKGLRVHAREIEEMLRTHPQIREVGVVGVPDIKVGEMVKAFVVLESDARGKMSESDVIAYCQGKLAHYKIPKIVEFVGEIPKTDVGKVSRRELREHEG